MTLMNPKCTYFMLLFILMSTSSILVRGAEFRDCWTLHGEIDDLGFNFAMNIGRLEIERYMRAKYPWPTHSITSVAYPNAKELSEQEREKLREKLLSECNYIFDGAGTFGNDTKIKEEAGRYPNISFGRFLSRQAEENPSLPNLVDHGGSWFYPSFLAGAVAASVSDSCACFINSWEEILSPWSHATGFMLGYHWRKPEQMGYVVTMSSWSDPLTEEQAVRQIVKWKGCDVFSRHTDTNTVDKYVHSLKNNTLSIAKLVDMSHYVGDTAFTSLTFQFKDLIIKSVESAFNSVLRNDNGPMYDLNDSSVLLGPQFFDMTLTSLTSLVSDSNIYNVTDVMEAGLSAYTYLTDVNPLCGARWRKPPNGDDNNADLPGTPCPLIDNITDIVSYLDLPNVIYYDNFTNGKSSCAAGGGEQYVYADDLSFTCDICPENTFAPKEGSATCDPCEKNTFSSPGSHICTSEVQKPVSKTFIYGVSISAVVLIGVIAGVAFWFVKKRKRNNKFAPKQADVSPIAIIFTDIQASTNLWANAPETMAKAVDDHHFIIRKIIAKHQGYEVKTIGDAFMIVHADITSAVNITLDIQRSLHRHDWGSMEIDDMYVQMIKDAHDMAQDEPSSPPKWKGPDLNFDDRKVWNGLRVRIGISHGRCNCEKDVVTGGWDYYGTPVNTAARVEAAGEGGQTLMTSQAYDALVNAYSSKICDNDRKHLKPSILSETLEDNLDISNPKLHRAVYLRGLKDPVDLFELSPFGYEGRQLFFESIQEFDNELNEEEGEDTLRSSTRLSQFSIDGDITSLSYEEIMTRLVEFTLNTIEFEKEHDARFSHEILVAHDRMKTIFSLHVPKKRKEIIQNLLIKWHLTVPKVSKQVTNVVGEDTPGLLMLSVRAATIVTVQEKKSILNVGSFIL